MTTGRRPTDKPEASPSPSEFDSADGLLTSQDLFGDMVDAPLEALPPTRHTRSTPIRVQINEPTTGEISQRLGGASTHEVREMPPEEVAALLDVLEPVPAFAPPPKAPPQPAPPKPGPPVATRPPSIPPPPPSGSGLPPEKSRIGARLAAAPPTTSEAPAAGVDLLGVAADAVESMTPPPVPLPVSSPAPPPERTAEPAEGEAPRPGERVYGPYRLLEKVAIGGMAEVFRAKRSGVEGFEKVVAVKRILAHLSDNKEFVDMFINEAKMVAGLTHPNIVQIFDLGKIDKSYYIAMEYLHSRDLRSIQKRAKEKGIRIPLDLSVLIVGKVCSALEYAHRKKDDRARAMKIVHRDVSPQNILISYEGDVKLTDFGIAKAATKATTTDRGALRGKLLYMSPEQAWGRAIDLRSDIFSLGVVFYEMVTDQRPFIAGPDASILDTVRECRVAAPTSVNPRIPERLERVLLKALAREPGERYQSAAELYRDLERFLHERQAPTSAELAKFMEVLFDEKERGLPGEDGLTHEHRSDEHRTDMSSLEMEFDVTPAGAHLPDTPPVPPRADDMSVQKLLKRFGLK